MVMVYLLRDIAPELDSPPVLVALTIVSGMSSSMKTGAPVEPVHRLSVPPKPVVVAVASS